jgi:hypothetical protein
LTRCRQKIRERVSAALSLYGGPTIRYAGVCSIDVATHLDEEASLLATRRNDKSFDVDLVCVSEFAQVIDETYARLDRVRKTLDA